MTNEERADLAEDLCERFASGQGLDWNEEKKEAISDLICDIGHLCDRLQIDFLQTVAWAISVHAAEVVAEDDLAPEPLVTIELGDRIVESKSG